MEQIPKVLEEYILTLDKELELLMSLHERTDVLFDKIETSQAPMSSEFDNLLAKLEPLAKDTKKCVQERIIIGQNIKKVNKKISSLPFDGDLFIEKIKTLTKKIKKFHKEGKIVVKNAEMLVNNHLMTQELLTKTT